jgi:NADH dehydrogenase
MNKKKIVILGAGQAGLALAVKLEKFIQDDYEIILIDKNSYIINYGKLHLLSIGHLSLNDVTRSIQFLLKNKNIKFIQQNILELLPNINTIILEKTKLEYDILIISTGSTLRYNSIEGAENHSILFQNVNNALLILDHLKKLSKEKIIDPIVIVGGGSTGVSIAGAIADYCKKYNFKSKILLIESSDTLLKEFSKKIGEIVSEKLIDKNVTIRLNTKILRIEKDGVYTENEEFIRSILTVIAAGRHGSTIKGFETLGTTSEHRIFVNSMCKNIKFDNIFAIGDIAYIINEDKKGYPFLSQIANIQATYLSNFLNNLLFESNKNDSLAGLKINIRFRMIPLGIDEYVFIYKDNIIYGNGKEIFSKLLFFSSEDKELLDIVEDFFEEEINELKFQCKKLLYTIGNK